MDPANRGIPPGALADVLDDVADALGTGVDLLGRLPGGVNAGALRIRLAGRPDAVLTAEARTHPGRLEEVRRAQRIVQHARRHGYPTPAWLAVGSTAGHVWRLVDHVDAPPAERLTPELIVQLMEITELQAGLASEPYDHWAYAWRIATGSDPLIGGQDGSETPEQSGLRRSVARLPAYSSAVAALVERARHGCAGVPPPRHAPDLVHADLATPTNALVRDGIVVAVVDIGNAGSGTRAIDLTALVWATFSDPLLDAVRGRLWTRILELVGWDQARVLAASHVLLMLELAVRQEQVDAVRGAVECGHRSLDELQDRR